MLSFWEKQSLVSTDFAVIGGGITGLSVAASLKETFPDQSVTVFERSVLPYGASTRNAGFACFGSLTEVLSDLEQMGVEKARQLLHDRWDGLRITRKRLGDEAIGFEPAGGFEILEGKYEEALDMLGQVNDLVSDFLPDYLSVNKTFAASAGLHPEFTIVEMKDEGQVDTGKLMRSLEAYVRQLGVNLRTGANLLKLERGNDWQLTVEDSSRGTLDFNARQVILCTNAFAQDLLPQAALEPGRGQVFITKPIPGLKFRGNLHIDEGYYYLRNVGDRLLFGGARNLDFETERSTEFQLNDQIQRHLEEKLSHLFREPLEFEVDMRWSGIMAFGNDKFPIVESLDDGLFCALKMGGMGIALAGTIGQRLVREIQN